MNVPIRTTRWCPLWMVTSSLVALSSRSLNTQHFFSAVRQLLAATATNHLFTTYYSPAISHQQLATATKHIFTTHRSPAISHQQLATATNHHLQAQRPATNRQPLTSHQLNQPRANCYQPPTATYRHLPPATGHQWWPITWPWFL